MLSKSLTYAIVGASSNPEKYGLKVLQDLQSAGFSVYPVNPKGGEILGLTVYNSLHEITPKPDVIVTVVPPAVTEQVVKEAITLGIANIWMQPGSENDESIRLCEKSGISVIHNACIMVQQKLMPQAA